MSDIIRSSILRSGIYASDIRIRGLVDPPTNRIQSTTRSIVSIVQSFDRREAKRKGEEEKKDERLRRGKRVRERETGRGPGMVLEDGLAGNEAFN